MTVRGKDAVFFIRSGDEYKPICCARTMSLNIATDIGETSTLSTGKWKTFKGLKLSYTCTAGGLVSFNMNHSLYTLQSLQTGLQPFKFRMFAEDAAGRTQTWEGDIIVTSVDTPSTFNGNFEYSMQATGSGPLVITTSSPVAGEHIYYGIQDASADPVDFSLYINDDPASDILINYPASGAPKFFWMAHPEAATTKTAWQDRDDTNNAGNIGAGTDLFETRALTILGEPYKLYMTRYTTAFTSAAAKLRYYLKPPPLMPPTDVTATTTVNPDMVTAKITVIFTLPTPPGDSYTIWLHGATSAFDEFYPASGSPHVINYDAVPSEDILVRVRTERAGESSAWSDPFTLETV